MPLPPPPAGRPLRLAFVGRRTRFEVCAPGVERPGLRTRFLEPVADARALRRELDAFRPHAVVAFGVDAVPAGALAGLPAPTLAVLVDPGEAVASPDFDRLVAVDPAAAAAEAVWRAVPLPVSDRLFRDVRPLAGPPRALVLGERTRHRRQMLAAAIEAQGERLHEADPAGLEEAERLLDAHDVGISLHPDDRPAFGHAVGLHLAAGHLLLTEPLARLHGLEPGIDYLDVAHAGGLAFTLERLTRFPRTWHRVRVRGRMKAEQFRASRVWSRLVHDLRADVAAFGTHRP